MYKNFFKSLLDFLLSLIVFIILSPIFLLVTIALFIAYQGKPFFFQLRPGKDGKNFKIIKFKTMNDKKDPDGNLLPDSERLTSDGVFGLNILNCSIDKCAGIWGDGILLLRSNNCSIENNKISNVQRIGIAADTIVQNLKSKNIIIRHNTVTNAKKAVEGQLNAGIWIENTYDAEISENTIIDSDDRGIVDAPLIKDNTVYNYTINNNTTTYTYMAIVNVVVLILRNLFLMITVSKVSSIKVIVLVAILTIY